MAMRPAAGSRAHEPRPAAEAPSRLPAKSAPQQAPLDHRQLAARAVLAPETIAPADVLRLQRAVGNRAVGAMLATGRSGAAGTVQRLLADGHTTAYVPKTWLDTTIDGRQSTVREVLAVDNATRQELYENLGTAAGITVGAVTQVYPARNAYATLLGDGYKLTTPGAKKKDIAERVKALRKELSARLADPHFVTILPGVDVEGETDAPRVLDASTLETKAVLAPNHLLESAPDLAAQMDIHKVCALIAIVKGEPDRVKLNAKLALHGNLGSDADYYEALHRHYWTGKGTQYDEEANLPALYAEWGYTTVFSGKSAFPDLYKHIRAPLATGKRYAFAITGHVVAVTMRKQLTPGTPYGYGETTANYFQFHSDVANYVGNEGVQTVEYIFEK